MSALIRRLRHDRRGLAMIEFALALPLLLLTTCFGVEIANYALTNLRVSQIALALADNAARVGAASNLATQQLREVDLNDVLQATRLQGQQLGLTQNGRITLSSLEADASETQRIHWQRCLGLKRGAGYESSYGTAPVTAGTQSGTAYQGTAVPGGMGDAGAKVTAPASSGVMFVEVNYLYKPIFGDWLLGGRERVIHYIASYIVRDRRDFAQIFNINPEVSSANKMTCNRFTEKVADLP